jgi:hypothetical protein
MSQTDSKRAAIEIAVKALVAFKHEFNCELTPAILAELYVALALDLSPRRSCNPGFDVMGKDGSRYQVKQRSADVLNVDVNNFDFDFLVLVNLADDYRLEGMWRLPVETARTLLVHREKFRKHQATQKAIKAKAERLS